MSRAREGAPYMIREHAVGVELCSVGRSKRGNLILKPDSVYPSERLALDEICHRAEDGPRTYYGMRSSEDYRFENGFDLGPSGRGKRRTPHKASSDSLDSLDDEDWGA